jgi:hypothetical protein
MDCSNTTIPEEDNELICDVIQHLDIQVPAAEEEEEEKKKKKKKKKKEKNLMLQLLLLPVRKKMNCKETFHPSCLHTFI